MSLGLMLLPWPGCSLSEWAPSTGGALLKTGRAPYATEANPPWAVPGCPQNRQGEDLLRRSPPLPGLSSTLGGVARKTDSPLGFHTDHTLHILLGKEQKEVLVELGEPTHHSHLLHVAPGRYPCSLRLARPGGLQRAENVVLRIALGNLIPSARDARAPCPPPPT